MIDQKKNRLFPAIQQSNNQILLIKLIAIFIHQQTIDRKG